MPLYEYQCKKCRHRFERIQRFSDPPVSRCPECGGRVKQLLSPPTVQFKGSGWYVTDYARKSSPTDGGAHEAGAKKADKSETSPKSESHRPKPKTSPPKE